MCEPCGYADRFKQRHSLSARLQRASRDVEVRRAIVLAAADQIRAKPRPKKRDLDRRAAQMRAERILSALTGQLLPAPLAKIVSNYLPGFDADPETSA